MPGMSEELTLVSVTYTQDAYQNEIKTRRTVFAEKLPSYSNEFYAAGARGIELQHVMKVHAFEYEGEKLAEYAGQEYDIYRVYNKNEDWCELYLSSKKRN